MEAFARSAPQWTYQATHAVSFCCPRCGASPRQATKVWLNRYAPVTMENRQRKWQEFYACECEQVWWAWSCDRPAPNNATPPNQENN
ncbi:hypothetical protein Cyast_2060 [Cyanobacterium stanieri PCC 7202]|uniref:Uncharacterized protein n=1 Tax=Cyanobacterium stanieri (strain ATCC 29140 / PCC 7202) TaxID=292563 RepID=K9YNL5_CYASC|nr:hypothetical protein Cyast_2060 [Cyanobacterium stanieri PCC 7202]